MSVINSNTSNSNRNANVSVTNIKCDQENVKREPYELDHHQNGVILAPVATTPNCNSYMNGSSPVATGSSSSSGGIRIQVPKVEDSDESESELANIENSSNVNRRAGSANKSGPRPMSWEGELSEPEDGMMDTENSVSNDKDFEDSQMSTTKDDSRQSGIMKADYEHTPVDPGGPVAFSSAAKKFQPDGVSLKYEPGLSDATASGLNSPLLARSKSNLLPANPSPDSAIHSVYTHSSPSQSPLTSRHAPYTPSLSRNNSDASHSSCYSYSSEFSPTHSPIQGRHNIYGNFNGSLHHSVLYRPIVDGQEPALHSLNSGATPGGTPRRPDEVLPAPESEAIPSPGISRQQLINSPCPICGDKISGFHYGIFSCESCKGFFKRTVQNRKNYVCVRGGPCPVTISTRKKCPACRFDKCLQKGMKLEAIREDRTRGGRSTYQCSYTLPNSMLSPIMNSGQENSNCGQNNIRTMMNGCMVKTEQSELSNGCGSVNAAASSYRNNNVPHLLQEIMDVEHLWQYNEGEIRFNPPVCGGSTTPTTTAASAAASLAANPLLGSAGITPANGENTNPDLIANLCNVADHRLYKIVKWCKSLPLFKNISIDDQICLLINSWCELLLFSCCFRSMPTPGEIKISHGKSITLVQAKSSGLQACIERMLNLTDHLRRLRVDQYEYVAMKVIVLLQSDTTELRDPVKVRESQEKALQALQAYTLAHYPETPAKFGELLLRIPELQKTCQLGKETLTIKSKDGEDFNLLMELLRGEH